MPFIVSARKRLATLSPKSEKAILLDYLLRHAVGRNNAKSWPVIETYLQSKGVSMNQQRFQQGVLKNTRSGSIFIASNDHGRSRGYFLIDDQADAQTMRDWYQKRIDRETENLAILVRLASKVGWKL